MTGEPDISAIMIAHAEASLAAISFRSLLDATAAAREIDLEVEILIVLDNPDPATLEALGEAEDRGARVSRVSYADQGQVRNHAVREAHGQYIAFLDGDDLWSENWLVEGHQMCVSDPGRIIAHPELDWIFDGVAFRVFMPDQTDAWFKPGAMRLANPWDTLCFAPAVAYVEHPFSKRAIAEGYAFEDWHWNIETVVSGYVHRVVPDTIHFKRRRGGSQFMHARANRSLTRPSSFHNYAWFREWSDGGGQEPDEQLVRLDSPQP